MTDLFLAIKSKSKRLKFFDWLILVFGLFSVLVFAVIFFRRSTHVIVTVKVGEDSSFYQSWLTGWPYWNDTSGSKTWFAELFHVGLTEKDGLGKPRAEVLNVYSYDKLPTRKTVYLTLKLNVVYNRVSKTHTYKGVPVLVGSKIKLNLDRIYTEGLITEVEGTLGSQGREKIVVEAQLREENATFLEMAGTKNYVADAIHVGDEVLDSNGAVIIRVVDKKVTPAQRTVVDGEGKVLLGSDPVRKDVYLTLEIDVLNLDNKYFLLDDVPVLVDKIVPINTKTYSVFPVVTKFVSVE